jgi:hypothetical protein
MGFLLVFAFLLVWYIQCTCSCSQSICFISRNKSKYLFHSKSDSSLYIFRQQILRSILRFFHNFCCTFLRFATSTDPTRPVTCDLWLVPPPAKSHQLTPSYYPKLVVHDAVATHHPVDILLFPISY